MNWMHPRKSWKKEILKPNRSITVAGTIVAVGAADGGSGDGIAAVSGIMAVGAGAAAAGVYGSGTGRIIEEPSRLGQLPGKAPAWPGGSSAVREHRVAEIQAAEGPGSSKPSAAEVRSPDPASCPLFPPAMTRSDALRAAGVASLASKSFSLLAASGW